jgi:hypothetical protein
MSHAQTIPYTTAASCDPHGARSTHVHTVFTPQHIASDDEMPVISSRWEFASFFLGILLGLIFFLITLPLPSQTIASAPTSSQAELQSMAQQAGVIFTGEVVSIRARDAQGLWLDAAQPTVEPVTASMLVEIRIRVEQGIRGPAADSIYTLREWGGLWSGCLIHNGRYRLHQRALFLFYPSHDSAAQLTSPVDGMDGVLPVTGPTSSPQVNLSLIQTHLLRAAPFSPTLIARPIAGPILHTAVLPPPPPTISHPAAAIAPLRSAAISADALIAAMRTWREQP